MMTNISKRALFIGVGVVAVVAIAGGVATFVRPAAAAVETGAAAPAFSAVDINGQTRTLAEFAGRTVVLEWDSYNCPYTRKHYDSNSMQTLQQEATGQGVVWLQVMSSAPGKEGYFDAAYHRVLAQRFNVHATATLLDPTGVIGHAYGARNTPQMFIIGADGRIAYQGAIDDQPSANPRSVEGAHNYVRAGLADIAAGRAVAVPETTPYGCSVKY